MFTIEQILNAHSKVRSGADFPAYIGEIEQLGVTGYDAFVTDGHTVYQGADGYQAATKAKYEPLTIAATANVAQFKADLLAHQQGKTNYTTFCSDCAKSGVEKWTVSMAAMTCTYYDTAGNELLLEQIPQ